ncbi:MAG: hypothetical protein HQL21_04770 [Candidatus Omnitrophica bacterium]|nr:hypothetical protein [Candidatus Omnitrophota bacterium]
MKPDRNVFLQKKEVIEEINRHKWIESERLGYDIGFDKAADDWFAKDAAWVKEHCPELCAKVREKRGRKTI